MADSDQTIEIAGFTVEKDEDSLVIYRTGPRRQPIVQIIAPGVLEATSYNHYCSAEAIALGRIGGDIDGTNSTPVPEGGQFAIMGWLSEDDGGDWLGLHTGEFE